MKILKKINNNYALALDKGGKPVIVYGKGIGFGKFPCEFNDLSKIEKSFYNIDTRFAELLETMDERVVQATDAIVSFAEQKLNCRLNPNLVFSLADHVEFSMKRLREGIVFNHGLSYDMEYLYPEEMEIAEKSVNYLQRIFNVKFPKSETSVIAMHILEAKNFNPSQSDVIDVDDIVDDLVEIVSGELGIKFDIKDFNYYRFVTHVKYLLNRKVKNEEITSINHQLFNEVSKKYVHAYKIALKIKDYFEGERGFTIGEEELLYLILHINRIRAK